MQRHVQCGDHLVNVLFSVVSNVHILDMIAEGSQGTICLALLKSTTVHYINFARIQEVTDDVRVLHVTFQLLVHTLEQQVHLSHYLETTALRSQRCSRMSQCGNRDENSHVVADEQPCQLTSMSTLGFSVCSRWRRGPTRWHT